MKTIIRGLTEIRSKKVEKINGRYELIDVAWMELYEDSFIVEITGQKVYVDHSKYPHIFVTHNGKVIKTRIVKDDLGKLGENREIYVDIVVNTTEDIYGITMAKEYYNQLITEKFIKCIEKYEEDENKSALKKIEAYRLHYNLQDIMQMVDEEFEKKI